MDPVVHTIIAVLCMFGSYCIGHLRGQILQRNVAMFQFIQMMRYNMMMVAVDPTSLDIEDCDSDQDPDDGDQDV